jgi:hypothetical protein
MTVSKTSTVASGRGASSVYSTVSGADDPAVDLSEVALDVAR